AADAALVVPVAGVADAEPVDAIEARRARRIIRRHAGKSAARDSGVEAPGQGQAEQARPPAHGTLIRRFAGTFNCSHSCYSSAMAETMLDVRGLAKGDAYLQLEGQIAALLEGLDDEVTAMATISCVIHHGLGHLWTGFYRVVGPALLRVGP